MGHSVDDAVHKILHKMKTHWQNQLKFWYWFDLISSIELDIKNKMLYLSNAPLIDTVNLLKHVIQDSL